MKITIVADNREKSSGVPRLLAEKDIDVKMAQLSIGDYMINDEIVIERKTKEDFVQSILNRHLFDQCSKLRKTRMIPLIIVEGNPFNTRHGINPEAIRGALLSVSLSWQIPIIRSTGKEDTVHLMLMASKQNLNPPVFVHRTGKKPKYKQSQQHYFVQNFPSIGPALARRLLAHFNTIEQIIMADIKSLEQVEGIGKTKAAKLYDFFRSQ